MTLKKIIYFFNYKNVSLVLSIVDSILQSDSVDPIVVHALKCAASWLDIGFDLIKCHRLTDTFISVILNPERSQE